MTLPPPPTPAPPATSVGLGAWFVDDADAGFRSSQRRRRVLHATAAGLLLVALGHTFAAVVPLVRDAKKTACWNARERDGFGAGSARRALDDPDRRRAREPAFVYRVIQEPHGYRARVLVTDGRWSGDAWERDELGRLSLVSDTCDDEADAFVADAWTAAAHLAAAAAGAAKGHASDVDPDAAPRFAERLAAATSAP